MITPEQANDIHELIQTIENYGNKQDYVGLITALYYQTTRLHLAIRRKATDRPPVTQQPTKEILNAEKTKTDSAAEPMEGGETGAAGGEAAKDEAPVEQEASGG